MYKIYLVEDDPTIAQILETNLMKWGYQVKATKNFDAIFEEFLAFSPHLVLLDITLPFYSGYHWCGEIRKISSIPIIFISSASADMNQIMAMNMGADDFIVKPFNLEIVTVKIQAILRRTYDFHPPLSIFEHKGVIFEPGTSTVSCHDQRVDLTKNEQRILLTLWENKGQTVSRDMLMQKLWDNDSFVDDNTLTVNVTRLRKKLEDIGLSNFIRTHKGQGYLLNE